MTKDTEALREALTGVRAWVASLTVTDMNEIVADGGITAGMVVGQEATEQLRRLDAALTPDTIGSHFGNGGGFDPSAELGFDPTAEVGDEVFPHDAGESAPVAWMLRSNETGEVIFDEVCVWRDRESAEDAVAEIDPELMEYSADAVPFPLYAHPPHPAPLDPVAGGEAWTCAARKQGSAGGNDPADCDWPFCGCDPYADKVLAVVEESALAALKGPAA